MSLATCLAAWLLAALLPSLSLALEPAKLAVIYNLQHRDSRIIAGLYADKHGIPVNQRIGIKLDRSQANLPAVRFRQLHAEVTQALPDDVQAFALVWDKPYRVDCMSITSAFAFGFDRKHCASGCNKTADNPYYGAVTNGPLENKQMRLAMLLSAGNTIETLALLKRGEIASGPAASAAPMAAYLVTTDDAARNTRAQRYPLAERLFAKRLPIHRVDGNAISDRHDVMFYFIGAKHVPFLDTLTFAPGAVADHLTSHGGSLYGSKQMSALAWLQAGATGSYGTVVEPCNFPQKFPDPPVLIAHYLNGDSLIEAYWKSVKWPGQGIFLGDPLARPFARAAGSR